MTLAAELQAAHSGMYGTAIKAHLRQMLELAERLWDEPDLVCVEEEPDQALDAENVSRERVDVVVAQP